jgi:tetratricopeptide (TPR) repeat protein
LALLDKLINQLILVINMGLFTKWKENKKLKSFLKKYETLSLDGDHKEALKILDQAIQEFPNNLSLIYSKAKELIANKNLKKLGSLFESINKLPKEVIENSGLKKVILTDLMIKSERDFHDTNFDPLISNDEFNQRETISNSKDFIEMVVRRSFYMCMKFNGRRIRGNEVFYPPEQIKFLAELNIKYCPKDKDWVLQWFYKEGMYAIERRQYEYALEILNEYINLTSDNKDDMAHNKFYSRGLAYFNLGNYKMAIKDFETSLKFTKEKELIKEVQDVLEESKRRLRK